MDVHFFSTGNDFPYVYYLAVMSALRTQKCDRINIWCTEESDSKYLAMLGDMKKVFIYNIYPFDIIPKLEAVIKKDTDSPTITKIRRAHLKDILGWSVLYNEGGLLLDLDTFCFKDLVGLLSNKDIATCVHSTWRFGPMLYPFENAIVLAKIRSDVIKEAYDESVAFLRPEIDAGFIWGCTGPQALSNAIHKNYHLVKFLEPGTFGCMVEELGNPAPSLYTEGGLLPSNARVFHMYFSSYREQLKGMDSDFIMRSNIPYARLVRGTLPLQDWRI